MTGPGNIDGILLDLWLRWSEEEGARIEQQETLRELFAEAKSEGLNPKALRAAFRRQFAALNETADARDKREQADEATEEYLAALARVRTREMIAASDDGSKYGNMSIYDPDFEITKPATRVPDTGAAADASEDAAALSLSEATITEAPKPSPAASGNDQPPTEAKTSEREPSEPEGSGGVQDRVGESTPPPIPEPDKPVRSFNPQTHFRSAGGLPRLHGCQEPDACAGSWRELCHGCRRVAEAI